MGILRFLGKLIAVILFLIFLITLPLTLWTYNVQSLLLNQATYDQLIETDTLYTIFLPILLPELIDDVPLQGADARQLQYAEDFFSSLTHDEWQTIIELLMPAEDLQSQISGNIDAIFEWKNGKPIRPAFSFDVTLLQDRMAGEQGAEVVSLIIDKQEGCSAIQQDLILSAIDPAGDGVNKLPVCRPDDTDVLNPYEAIFIEALSYTSSQLPSTISIEDAGGTDKQWLNAKLYVRVAENVSYLIFLIPTVILLLIEIITIRSWRGLFLWFGWSLFLGGLLGIVLLLPLSYSPILAWQIASGTVRIDPAFVPVIVSMSNLLNAITQPVLLQGGAITAVGLILLGLASAISRRSPT